MNSIAYLSGWDPSLCFLANDNRQCDMNRFLYKGFPRTKHLQQDRFAETAERDGIVLQFKDRFAEAIEEGVSLSTLYCYFIEISLYLRWCDKENIEAFTQVSLESYFEHLLIRVHLKQIKKVTYTKKLTNIATVFRDFLDLPGRWFLTITTTGKNDSEPFEAYTSSDLKLLLPLLRKLFDQTTAQFLENPQKHIAASQRTPTMTFHWKGEMYQLCGAITKMMCAATYLLSYYTYSNTGVLLGLTRPSNASMSVGEEWYTMPAFKRRAFKIIHVEMGQHTLDIPKYSISFFDRLLEVSKVIDDSKRALLFQTYVEGTLQPINKSKLQSFCGKWLDIKFQLADQKGRKLRPVISRFRETGAQLTAFHQGETASGVVLDNEPAVRKKHYSTGNRLQNNGMLQDTASIRQEQAEKKEGTKAAQASLNIDVLTIEEAHKVSLPNLSKTPNGSSCANPFGEKSEAYNRKARKHNLLMEGEKLACADLLSCFGCSEQVVVQSVSDIWCLISFRSCIEESLYLHLDTLHFRQNFQYIINFIDNNILPKISKHILKQAEERFGSIGAHPLWEDAESVISMLPPNKGNKI
ncbi:phage integrase N-terminal SAM-like domain-containing protein [Vibrio cholerae]